jgi:aminomethyltransferase
VAQGIKKTPLYNAHRRAGAKMVEFAGWEMPVQYRGIIEEHLNVRSRAGLFDVSHMGEIEIHGPDAVALCQRVSANDVARLKVFQAQYNLLLNDQGGVVDDIIVYRLDSDRFLICVNASNSDKDYDWIREHGAGEVSVENTSQRYAQIALQGPAAVKILKPLTSLNVDEIQSFYCRFGQVLSVRCLVARTGYTGEDGFELYCHPEGAERLWIGLLEAGAEAGLMPVGLGARDTLRLEKSYPLYGHELDEHTTPLEAGLEWVTKFSKEFFIGREALLRQKREGMRRKLAGLELLEPGIARSDYRLFKDERIIGRVTSGTRSPTLGRSIALAYVSLEEAYVDNTVQVEIRNRKIQAKIVPLPFYSRQ